MQDLIKQALNEDLGRGDLFSLFAEDKLMEARITCKDEGIFAGEIYLRELCKMQEIKLDLKVADGESIKKGDIIAVLNGSSNMLLKCERTMLNFIQHASGIATKTNKIVRALKELDVKLLDTRKTRPGLRVLEKYAVRCGGATNHRLGLDDCLMLKDTHLRAVSDLGEFFKKARAKMPWTSKIEIECDSFEEAQKSMQAGADIVMCDNMSPDEIVQIVKFRNENFPKVLLEASGNINENTIYEYAKTGVEAVSSGSMIHQAVWLDFSMRLTPKA